MNPRPHQLSATVNDPERDALNAGCKLHGLPRAALIRAGLCYLCPGFPVPEEGVPKLAMCQIRSLHKARAGS